MIAVYGGVVLFSALMLYQTQSIIQQCERTPHYMTYDPISASIGIYMSTINLFVRILSILASGKKKWSVRKKNNVLEIVILSQDQLRVFLQNFGTNLPIQWSSHKPLIWFYSQRIFDEYLDSMCKNRRIHHIAF